MEEENGKISPNLTLFALAINAFTIGSTEFISVGLLPMIVKSFHISLSQAGLTVSFTLLGVTIGAPLLTILTGKWNRRSLMLGIMLLFISGNLIAAFAPTFIILLVGRILSALAHFHVCFDCHRRRCCAAIFVRFRCDDWGAVINNFDRKMESSLINAGDYASFH